VKMKALILAAGNARRMLPLTESTPKCLLKVGEKTILEYLLDNFSDVGIKEAVIVVGFQEDMIKDLIGGEYNGMKITYCYNREFSTTNTMRSLWNARQEINGPFIQCHGDIIFHKDILRGVISSLASDEIVVEGNPDAFVDDGLRIRVDGFRVVDINKIISKRESRGRAFGIYKFSKEGADAYYNKMSEHLENEKEIFEVPLKKILPEVGFRVFDVKGLPFLEVDDLDDLDVAREKINSVIK
jgi:choline kinase